MKVIVYLLGFGNIAMSAFLILYTRETVDWFKDLFQTYQLKYLSAIPAIFAVLFLISAPTIKYPWLFWLIGILAVVEAVAAFTDPEKIYSRMLDWYFGDLSDQTHRLFGIIGLIFGTVILTWIK